MAAGLRFDGRVVLVTGAGGGERRYVVPCRAGARGLAGALQAVEARVLPLDSGAGEARPKLRRGDRRHSCCQKRAGSLRRVAQEGIRMGPEYL